MKAVIYFFLGLGLVYLADWLWYQYWYNTSRLEMGRSDGHVMIKGRCYTL